jgi:hypothetical protein
VNAWANFIWFVGQSKASTTDKIAVPRFFILNGIKKIPVKVKTTFLIKKSFFSHVLNLNVGSRLSQTGSIK